MNVGIELVMRSVKILRRYAVKEIIENRMVIDKEWDEVEYRYQISTVEKGKTSLRVGRKRGYRK